MSNRKYVKNNPRTYLPTSRISVRPTLSQYGLNENVVSELQKIDAEFIETRKTERKKNAITGSIFALFVCIYLATSEYSWAIVFIIYFLVFFVPSYINEEIKPPYTVKHRRHKEYLNDLRNYEHWKFLEQKMFWDMMDGQTFERKVAQLFAISGFEAILTKHSGDGGVDVILSKGSRKIAVQCKRYEKPVGPHVIRDLLGTMTYLEYKEGIIITTTGFTKGVKEFVKNYNNIYLLDINDILKAINNPTYLYNKLSDGRAIE